MVFFISLSKVVFVVIASFFVSNSSNAGFIWLYVSAILLFM